MQSLHELPSKLLLHLEWQLKLKDVIATYSFIMAEMIECVGLISFSSSTWLTTFDSDAVMLISRMIYERHVSFQTGRTSANKFELCMNPPNLRSSNIFSYIFMWFQVSTDLASYEVVTWGDPSAGGDSTSVSAQLTKVRQVFSTYRAFAAVKDERCRTCWGRFCAIPRHLKVKRLAEADAFCIFL